MPCNKKKRRRLYFLVRKQKYRCYYCSRKIRINDSGDSASYPWTATVDHFIPRSQGGTNLLTNCVAACTACNNKKKDMYPVDFFQRHPHHDIHGQREKRITDGIGGVGKTPAAILQAQVLETGTESAAARRAKAIGRMIQTKTETQQVNAIGQMLDQIEGDDL